MIRKEFKKDAETSAKGRNGYFTPASIQIHNWLNSDLKIFHVEIIGTRVGKHAPIVLNLSRDNAITLASAIADALANQSS